MTEQQSDDWIGEPDAYEMQEYNADRTCSDNDCAEGADYYVHEWGFACEEHRPGRPVGRE